MENASKSDILLVDDDPENIKVLGNLLVDDYRIRVATNGPEALEIIGSEDPPEIVILDLVMPGMDGYEVCRQIKNIRSRKDIPVIMIVTGESEAEQKKGFVAGAADYISKPFNAESVKARVRVYAELLKRKDDYGEQTFIDNLTGLPNGNYFESILTTAFDDAVKHSRQFAILRIKIDAFDAYAEAYGQETADTTVKSVVQIIRAVSSAGAGRVYRLEGGDFACILTDASEQEAYERAEAIRASVFALGLPHQKSSVSSAVTVSQGLAGIRPEVEENAFELERSAEHALFRAVQQGGNQICSAETNRHYRTGKALGASVLVVDDIAVNRELAGSALEQAGYKILYANNGKEALDRIPEADAVISDLLMPVMDGYELLRFVREDTATAELPFIIYTATYTQEDDRKLALELGADMFLVKPVDSETLVAALGSVLEGGTNGEDHVRHAMPENEFLHRHSDVMAKKLEKKIRDLEEATIRLNRERDNVAAIIGSAKEGFALINRDLSLRSANAAWCRAVSLGSPFMGLPLYPGDTISAHEALDAESRKLCKTLQSVASGGSMGMSGELCAGKQGHWYLVHAMPLTTGDGGVVVSLIDIDNTKRTEQKAVQFAKRSQDLMHELMHRTNNNLQIVSSMFHSFAEGADSRIASMLGIFDHRVQNIAMLLDLVYNCDDIDHVPLGEFVQKLFASLYSSKPVACPRLEFSFDFDDTKVDSRIAMGLGLALAELLEGAVNTRCIGACEGFVKIGMRANPDGTRTVVFVDSGGADKPELMAERDRFLNELICEQLGGTYQAATGAGNEFMITLRM